MGLDLGGRGFDLAAVDDLFEPGTCREVVDVLGRIGAGRDLVGARNRKELDVDLHVGGFRGCRRGAQVRDRGGTAERSQRPEEPEQDRLRAILRSMNMPPKWRKCRCRS